MKSDKIEIEEWQITICDSVLDATHHGGRKITEFFIPEKEIAFNLDGSKLVANVFKTERSKRYYRDKDDYFHQPAPEKIRCHFVSKKFVDFLEEYLRLKDSLFDECSKVIGAMK